MIGTGALRREQQEHNIDRRAVDRIEINRFGKPSANAGDALQPGELAVRYRDALAEPSRSKALALEQRVEDIALLQAGEPRRARRQFLKKLLLGFDLERSNYRFGADEIS